MWYPAFGGIRLSKKSIEQDGGKEDSVKGTQEGFLSRQIARPQATDFGSQPKSGSPGNTVAGATQEGFLSRQIIRPYPKGISSPLRGSGTGDKLRPKAAICLSLSKNPSSFLTS